MWNSILLHEAKERFKMKENSNKITRHLPLHREQNFTGYIVCCPTLRANELSYLHVSSTCFLPFSFVETVQNNQMAGRVTTRK